MARPWLATCVWCLATTACVAADQDDTVMPYRGDTDVAPALPDCMVMLDPPPRSNHPWRFDGPPGADVVWGVRPAASWKGMAAMIEVGPGGGCSPCTLTSTDFGGLFATAAELAVELEVGCHAEVLTTERSFAVAGLRLNLHGTEGGGHFSLFDLPLKLTTLNEVGDDCVIDNADGSATRPFRQGAEQLEPGRTLDYRIPLGPLVARAGHDPEYTNFGFFDVRLEVYAAAGSTAWIELGRTLLDGCE